MQIAPPRIEAAPGYTPTIGRLVSMLTYSRSTTLAAVNGLTTAQLDHLHDDQSNSIGALLAHFGVVELSYQAMTFEDRSLSPEELSTWAPALKLGEDGRAALRGQPLEHYLNELATIRAATLATLGRYDDAWLERPVTTAPKMNIHWVWFHLFEHEINHRGQIRWLRSRLPQ